MTLGSALSELGWTSTFAVRKESIGTVPPLAGARTLLIRDDEPELAQIAAFVGDARIDLAVIDHYGLDAEYEAACRRFAERIMVIDDLADRRHDCDILLDQTVGRRAAVYHALVPGGCRLLLGGDYALLRRGFAAAREKSIADRAGRNTKRFMISFGASDPYRLSPRVSAAVLGRCPDAVVDVVPDAAGLEESRTLEIDYPGRINVHFDVRAMELLMAHADVGIGAAGTTSWERCAMGLPTVLTVTADNQRQIAASLAEAGAAIVVDGRPSAAAGSIADAAVALARDSARLLAMGRAAASLVDAKGAERVAAAVLALG